MGEQPGLDRPRPGTAHLQPGAVDLPGAVDMEAERKAEQDYLDHAHACLEAMSVRTGSAVADAAERAPGDWDATVAHIHLTRRLASISSEAGPLCFGRIDEVGPADRQTGGSERARVGVGVGAGREH